MIVSGHPHALHYTPRQMFYYLALAKKRRTREAHHELEMMSLATQGDKRSINAQLRALKKEMNK